MIKLIVGLGNPGQQYEKTRHNVGFWFVDALAERCNANWSVEKKFNGRYALVEMCGNKVYLLKPDTFMNLSGQSVSALQRYYNLALMECLIVHDELDFEPGALRIKQGGGHAGHNGLKSIIACLGGAEFKRMRFGIGRPKAEGSVADYVLSVPSRSDFIKIESAIETGLNGLDGMVSG